MTSLLIAILTMCITLFDQWATFTDFTYQNILRNSTGVVAEILCIVYLCVESDPDSAETVPKYWSRLLVLGRLLVWSSIRSSRHARSMVDHGTEWSTENEYNALALVCLKPKIVHNASNFPRRQPNPWLPIYRIMYNKMKINLPLCCYFCCFLHPVHPALRRCKQHG